MDETSGFPESNGMDAIWVFMDKLSKMVHLVAIKKLGFGSEEVSTSTANVSLIFMPILLTGTI